MFLLLSVGTQYFIFRKLRAANVSKIIIDIYLFFVLMIFISGSAGSIDFGNPSYDFMPGRTDEIFRAISLTWTIITILAFFAFMLVDFVTGFKTFTRKKLYIALVLTVAGTLYCMFEAYYVTGRNVIIHTAKLPEDVKKLRIVFLTDVHIGGLSTYKHFERIMKLTDEAEPDIILLGGDIIDGDMSYRKRELALLTETVKRAKYGAFAVNGNHEYYLILDEDVEGIIRSCGINMMINERAEVAGIVIIGLDDTVNNTWLRPYLKPDDAKKFVLVLKHRPMLPVDSDGNFDLQLSGHTHGGQFWPLGYFKNMAANSVQGLSQKKGGYVYVSNGSGFNGAMMRMFVPPEITIIDIVKE